MRCFQGQVFVVGSTTLLWLVGGQLEEEQPATLLRCASFLKEGGGDTMSCEACLENHCGWDNGRCVAPCDDDAKISADGPCFPPPQDGSDPSDYYILVEQVCAKATSSKPKILELDGSSSSSLILEDKRKKHVQREVVETSSENNNNATTSSPNEDEGLLYGSSCRRTTECISCYENPTCTWNNGTCSDILPGGPSSLPNRTVAAEVFCTSNYDDDLLEIFNDVVAAIEKAKEEDEEREEGEGDVVDVGVDATTTDGSDSEGEQLEASEGIASPSTITVAATGTATGTVSVTSASTTTSQLWFVATAFLVVASHLC